MDQNRDWKPVAALVLAALALFVALGGARGRDNDQVSAVPQQIIVQPAAPPSAQTGGAVAPQAVLPVPPADNTHAWGPWAGGGPGGSHRFFFPLLLFPLLLFAGLALLAFKVAGRRRYGGGGPGWYGRPWGPGPGPQGPPQGQPYEQYQQYQQYQQYPQYPQGYGQGQPYGGGYYPQGQQPQQPQQPPQGQPPQANGPADDTHGDITRPQGNGN
jgi:hypothetical protein